MSVFIRFKKRAGELSQPRAIFTVLFAVALVALLIFGVSARREKEVVSESFHLGTYINLRAYGRDKKFLETELNGAKSEMSRLEGLFSANIADSDISRAGASSGEWVEISAETASLAARSLEIANMTGGTFDPTIGAIVKLWGIGTSSARVPSREETAQALAAAGWEKVSLCEEDGKYFIKLAHGQMLDMGAIAKGRVADIVRAKLADDGVTCALLNLGGNVVVIGSAPNGGPWKIGIQHPDEPRGEYIGFFAVTDSSVVTSGAYERYFEADGVRYCHIFDPSTGLPAVSDISSVTIADADSTFADALCTALYVMGCAKSLEFMRARPDIAAVVVSDKKVYITPAAKKTFTLTDKNFTLEEIPQ